MNWFDKILFGLEIGAEIAKDFGMKEAELVQKLTAIAQAANAAQKKLSGVDIDPSTLGQLPPLPPLPSAPTPAP